MTSSNISITKKAYKYLNNSKTLLKFSGILKHINWQNREKNMDDFRNELEKRF